ncbi:DUF2812 domain-containing protein [Sporosarcina sp. 179-K 3D1 HS]|uniref:DUF2812 domain-containing protein n=1 Tax=Sporosarcina sp. 179-K 3D1 HS TaxID=3232169 RepID=UPI00399F7749
MNKTVLKLRPSDYWRIGKHESWLADLAAQGLHLKKMGSNFARFEKGEPRQTRYRIDVSIEQKMSPEQIQLYAENGWEYVTKRGDFYVFSSPVERHAPELHTDPAEQAYTLKRLDQKLVMNAVLTVVATLLMIGMLSAIWLLDNAPMLVLVEGMAIQQTIVTIFVGYVAYTSLQAALSIRALRKTLVEGRPMDHQVPWQKRYRLRSTLVLLFAIVIGLSAILPFTQLVKGETNTLPETDSELPIVRLADIEQDARMVRGEPYLIDQVDWSNRYTYHWGPLAPVQYETDENGVVPGKVWGDHSGDYSPSVHTRVFQLTAAAMADPLVSDLVERYQFGNEQFIETEHPDLDRLLIHEKKEAKELVASIGKTVMYVRYHGHAELTAVVEETVGKMKQIAE